MQRRHFLHAAVSSLFVPHGVLMATGNSPDKASVSPDYVFYDARFIEARRLAGRMSNGCVPTPVGADMTDVWNGELGRKCRHLPMTVHGVTTESFFFCLQGMVRSVTGMDSAVTRINRDLFAWQLRSNNDTSRLTGI